MNSKRCFEKSVLYKVSITMFLSYEYFQHHNITIAELWNQNPRFRKTAGGRPPGGRHKNVNFFNIFFNISILGNNCCLKLWEDVHLIFLRPQLRRFAFKQALHRLKIEKWGLWERWSVSAAGRPAAVLRKRRFWFQSSAMVILWCWKYS